MIVWFQIITDNVKIYKSGAYVLIEKECLGTVIPNKTTGLLITDAINKSIRDQSKCTLIIQYGIFIDEHQ